MWSSIDVLTWPETAYPTVNTDWLNMSAMEILYLEWVSFTADQAAPMSFWLTQTFTFGESKMSDSSIFFMDQNSAAFYFFWNAIWTTSLYPFALIWVVVWGWAYLLEWFIEWLLEMFVETESTCPYKYMDKERWNLRGANIDATG